ncbi:integron integrase [Desulfonauticus submarinus]|uniref:Integron integrase n=1 Tax=Desulfonauticus submarinus TaxID=206665 RepID=A0A1H0F694_9BACT|nr:integron integrase [Desulfonauticus submarinus]SDN90091.1 integron integrase [Desulfonauticus submarinus]
MRKDFEKFLLNTVRIEERKVPYYLRWVGLLWKEMGGKWGERIEEDQQKRFLNLLEKKIENWQLHQAKEAISFYNYYWEKVNKKEQANVESMAWEQFEENMIKVLRLKHFSYRTERTYLAWIRRLKIFVEGKSPYLLNSKDVQDFLSWLAIEKKVSPSTQNQALNAFVFFFKKVLEKDLKVDALRAKERKRIPVVLSRKEVKNVLNFLEMPYKLMCLIIYGSGLRLAECIRLRVKDLDLEKEIIVVRSGKGDKDRVTLLSSSIVPLIIKHLETVKKIFLEDRKNNIDGVMLPHALEKKYPNAGKEWGWFWVFPSPRLSVDPRTKIIRRHHLHVVNLQKVFKTALKQAGISKPASVHSLRHSFATHLLEDGYDIRTVQELLGHKHVQTTMIYTHIAKRNILGVKSPLDNI